MCRETNPLMQVGGVLDHGINRFPHAMEAAAGWLKALLLRS